MPTDLRPFRRWLERAGHDPATITDDQAPAMAADMSAQLHLTPEKAAEILAGLRGQAPVGGPA